MKIALLYLFRLSIIFFAIGLLVAVPLTTLQSIGLIVAISLLMISFAVDEGDL